MRPRRPLVRVDELKVVSQRGDAITVGTIESGDPKESVILNSDTFAKRNVETPYRIAHDDLIATFSANRHGPARPQESQDGLTPNFSD